MGCLTNGMSRSWNVAPMRYRTDRISRRRDIAQNKGANDVDLKWNPRSQCWAPFSRREYIGPIMASPMAGVANSFYLKKSIIMCFNDFTTKNAQKWRIWCNLQTVPPIFGKISMVQKLIKSIVIDPKMSKIIAEGVQQLLYVWYKSEFYTWEGSLLAVWKSLWNLPKTTHLACCNANYGL